MKPHEKRIMDEYTALLGRLTKLREYFDKDEYNKLDTISRRLLEDQEYYMSGYLNILGRRIIRIKMKEIIDEKV